MLITRTPLRISIGGGGTDLPSYYERFGAFVIAAAIDKYIFVGSNKIFTSEYCLKYSALERVSAIDEIAHPIFRTVLKLHDVPPSIELVSLADIPAGTGLGSSGTFTVGLLRNIYALKREYVSPEALAEQACDIEMNHLGEPVGKQDQYVASLGGLICIEISKCGTVGVSPLRIDAEVARHLEDHLLMFFTGYSRKASSLLEDQVQRSMAGDEEMLNNLHFVKDLGFEIKHALESAEPERFGELMHEHWLHKRSRSHDMTNPCIDHWYEVARRNGALGGKLIGAGGGGFLLFYAANRKRLRAAMASEGLEEVHFRFDHDGSTVLARSVT